MTTYTFIPNSTAASVNWDSPAIWSGGVVPNSADATVVFPLSTIVSTGAPYLSNVTIKSGETFAAGSIDLNNKLTVAGTLNVAGAVTNEINGTINISGTLTVGSLNNLNTASAANGVNAPILLSGGALNATSLTNMSLSGYGAVNATTFAANATLQSTAGLTVSVSAFTDSAGMTASGGDLTINAHTISVAGTIFSAHGGIKLNADAGGLSGLANGIWSGPTLNVDGSVAINAGSVITTDNSLIQLYGGTVTSRDPATGQDVALTSSLKTIGTAGTLEIGGTYQFGDLKVDGQIFLPYASTFFPTPARILTANSLTIDPSGIVHGMGTIQASIINNGTIIADPNPNTLEQLGQPPITNDVLKIIGVTTGTGTLEISAPVRIFSQGASPIGVASTTIELAGASNQNVVFDGNSGTLQLDSPASFAGTIRANALAGSIGTGDTIVLQGVSLTNSALSYSGDHFGGTLTAQSTTGPISLKFVGYYSQSDFSLTSTGQTLSTDPATYTITINHHTQTNDLLFYTGSQYTVWTGSVSGAITPTNSAPSLPTNAIPLVQADFNGDGSRDILLQNSSNQTLSVLQYQASPNGSYGGFGPASGFTGAGGGGWAIAGVGDFNGDGKADLLWRNAGANATAVWQSTGSAFNTGSYLDTAVSRDWHVAGTGDVNGDGKDDIVWRNDNGTLAIWTSTGSDFNRSYYFLNSLGTDWHVEGVGDFNGDGKADLLWRNDNGAMSIWSASGNSFDPHFYSTNAVGNDWQIAKISDINGDGVSDILWRDSSGDLSEWLSTGHGFTTSFVPNGAAAAGWHLVNAPSDFV